MKLSSLLAALPAHLSERIHGLSPASASPHSAAEGRFPTQRSQTGLCPLLDAHGGAYLKTRPSTRRSRCRPCWATALRLSRALRALSLRLGSTPPLHPAGRHRCRGRACCAQHRLRLPSGASRPARTAPAHSCRAGLRRRHRRHAVGAAGRLDDGPSGGARSPAGHGRYRLHLAGPPHRSGVAAGFCLPRRDG